MKEMQNVKNENCPEDICWHLEYGLDRRFIKLFSRCPVHQSSMILCTVNMSEYAPTPYQSFISWLNSLNYFTLHELPFCCIEAERNCNVIGKWGLYDISSVGRQHWPRKNLLIAVNLTLWPLTSCLHLPGAVRRHQAMAGNEMEMEQTQTITMREAALLSLILIG